MGSKITIATKIPRERIEELRALAKELEYPTISDMIRAAVIAYMDDQKSKLNDGRRLEALQQSIREQSRSCPMARLLFVDGLTRVAESTESELKKEGALHKRILSNNTQVEGNNGER